MPEDVMRTSVTPRVLSDSPVSTIMPSETPHHYEATVEQFIARQIYNLEYTQAKSDNDTDNTDFEAYVDLFDSVRAEKEYEWMSDVSIPEFASHELTQQALDAAQYFQSRDFVQCYIQDESDEAKNAADANQRLINRTLNDRDLFHYMKYLRAKSICNLTGRVYIHAWWEKETKQVQVGTKERVEELDVDVEGNPLTDRTKQTPATRTVHDPVHETRPVRDRFMYDVLDNRNVFTDRKYCYSLQQKNWIIVRSEKSYLDLKADEKVMNYINLDLLKPVRPSTTTETSTDTLQRDTPNTTVGVSATQNPAYYLFDVFQRYGKMWAIVEDRKDGRPITARPGIDQFGNPLPDAEFIEVICTVVSNQGQFFLIRFQPQPYLDQNDQPYRPITRGLCYIHPTKDGGAGDGRYSRDLQVALNDTFNVSNDRVMLATLPTLKVKRYTLEDNPDIYFEPMHAIPCEDPNDVQEFKIQSDIQGAIAQAGMLMAKMQQVNAISLPTTGRTPEMASTTATAIADAGQHASIRMNLKGLTFENTALTDMYWFITQMTHQFAHPMTGEKLMGSRLRDFKPELDYFYKPVTQSIETEYAKQKKIQNLDNIMSKAVAVQHPDLPKVINYLMGMQLKYMGDEEENYKAQLFDTEKPMMQGQTGTPPAQAMTPPSNQTGLPQSTTEQMVRSG